MLRFRTKRVVVKAYRTPRSMQRGIARMTGHGYIVEGQSGEFSPIPWLTPRYRMRRVVVTFRLDAEKAPAPPVTAGQGRSEAVG